MSWDELGYGALIAFAAALSFAIRRAEGKRLGYLAHPGYRWVGLWCVWGAVVGARAGTFFYEGMSADEALRQASYTLGFDGKTVLGALTGGYIFGELGKKIVGVRFSTGDALAVALPVGQAIGRLGCLWAGCCYGTPTDMPWAIHQHGVLRHPTQLYEAIACGLLAGGLYAIRHHHRPAGHLFRYYLIGYAAIRFFTETFRGEPQIRVGPLTSAQLYCFLMGLLLLLSVWRTGATADQTGVRAHSRAEEDPLRRRPLTTTPDDRSQTSDPTA